MSDAPPDDGPWMDYRGTGLETARAAGTLYDGAGTRLLGNGPVTATLAELLAELGANPFKIVLGKNKVLATRESYSQDDRIWLLPDDITTPPGLPAELLQELANRLADDRRIGLAGSDELIGADVMRRLDRLFKLLTEEPLGSA